MIIRPLSFLAYYDDLQMKFFSLFIVYLLSFNRKLLFNLTDSFSFVDKSGEEGIKLLMLLDLLLISFC
jgi:hypothetical protein